MRQDATYTPGYTQVASDFMAQRSAESHASFVLPYIRATTRLLDCGCGPGTITCDLAAMMTAGNAVGIDLEPSQIDLATRLAVERRLENVSFRIGSIFDLPFAESSFDVVFAHAVFEHIRDPVAALREMQRVLVPGGVVAIRSPDWGGFLVVPELPGVSEAMNHYAELQIANGGDIRVGRKLPTLLDDAGFVPSHFSAVYDCTQSAGMIAKYLSLKLPAPLAAAMKSWGDHPYAAFAQTWCQAVGEKAAYPPLCKPGCQGSVILDRHWSFASFSCLSRRG